MSEGVAPTRDPARSPLEPDPLREEPPADRFCDLVLNGGVASGVVYPWALVELARRYRFRNIGGNSVGAMAAAMAAAAEYGRCTGVEDAFEPLRRFPQELARERDGLPQMLRLFQPGTGLQRLFQVFLLAVRGIEGSENMAPAARPKGCWPLVLIGLYAGPFLLDLVLAVSAVVVLALLAGLALPRVGVGGLLGLIVLGAAAGVVAGLRGVWRDLAALAENDYGLCRGKSTGSEEALVEWLHRGIQCSAGRGEDEPPLTFADLWAAPRCGVPGPSPLAGGLQPPEPGINLQVFASNVTQGRPIRLPLNDANTRLYYHPKEWALMFPATVMRALERASSAYAPASGSDPGADTRVRLGPQWPAPERDVPAAELRELPSGGMPLVVAARLSLCFPLLFSCVPVYAVDYESVGSSRVLRRCLLSDGGLCSNFPVHLFDAACPRWPTFALELDKRLQMHRGAPVWLPPTHLEGRADNWQRGVPGAEFDDSAAPRRTALARLAGVAAGMLSTTKDWNDRMTSRLPTVRNRVVHIALERGEGLLNIAMPGATMLRMAREYGLESARQLIEQFAPASDGTVAQGWRDHLYVRTVVEVRALRDHLRGFGESVRGRGDTLPLRELLAEVTTGPPRSLADLLDPAAPPRPLAARPGRADPAGAPLLPAQRDALCRALAAVETLETALAGCEAMFGPYVPVLAPELHLRPPV